jgi:mitochondrial fission protein ELM1
MMKPTLPSAWFDLCFIPEHDRPSSRPNIKTTRGALNTIVPSTVRDPHKGLILIGGPSRHYRWDEDRLMHQLQHITEGSALRWDMTDSPRTPDSTRQRLPGYASEKLVYTPCHETPRGWVGAHLQNCTQVWVTEDSVSMLYEALSSGSAVGLLDVPTRKASDRIAMAVRRLADEGLVTPYDEWVKLGTLKSPATPLNEADRCARIVAERYTLPLQYSNR